MSQSKPFRFTGYHAAAILVAFFGVIVIVNFTMARFALSTFGGTVVDNSYVASQKYNEWLQQARDQAALGWQLSDAERVDGKLQLHLLDRNDAPLTDAKITVLAEHPVGRTDDQTLSFTHLGDGRYQSSQALPTGRRKLKIKVVDAGQAMRAIQDIK